LDLQWTPNTIYSEVVILDDMASIKLKSETPSFKEYQMLEIPSTEWVAVVDSLALKLEKNRNEFHFRAVNAADAKGPIYKLIFKN
jgi:hypothetical protein